MALTCDNQAMTPLIKKNRAVAALAAGLSLAAGAAVLHAVGAGTAHADPGPEAEALHSTCREVLWVGDSTSIAYFGGEGTGTVTPSSAKSDEPLPTALLGSGVTRIDYDVYGGRSAHETVNGHPSAVDALAALVAANPTADCAVYSGGTNDSANIAVGSQFSAKDRLTALNEARGQARLYVTTAAIDPSAKASGYDSSATAPWNQAIATLWKPSLVINHAGHLAPGQFEQDGIHYTAAGTAARIDLANRVLAADPTAMFNPNEANASSTE